MNNKYIFKTFLTFILSFFIVGVGFCASSYIQKKKMHGENLTTFITTPVKRLFPQRSSLPEDYRHQIRVELLIKQNFEKEEGRIASVYFDGKQIPFSADDPAGLKNPIFVRVPPGTHTIVWNVSNHHFIWPKTTTIKRNIVISKDQLWVYVLLEGEEIQIR